MCYATNHATNHATERFFLATPRSVLREFDKTSGVGPTLVVRRRLSGDREAAWACASADLRRLYIKYQTPRQENGDETEDRIRTLLVVILLALMSYSKYVHSVAGLNFKQRDVSRRAKRNDEFSQKRIFRNRLPTRERRETQYFNRAFDCLQGTVCNGQVLFQHEVIEAK